jgi:hypothetical protein
MRIAKLLNFILVTKCTIGFACWPVCLLANEQGHLLKPANGLTESLQVEQASIQAESLAISEPMSWFTLSHPEAHFVFSRFFSTDV